MRNRLNMCPLLKHCIKILGTGTFQHSVFTSYNNFNKIKLSKFLINLIEMKTVH